MHESNMGYCIKNRIDMGTDLHECYKYDDKTILGIDF